MSPEATGRPHTSIGTRMTLQDEMEAFFATYVDAFRAGDVDSIAELWEPVGLFPSPTGNFAMERDTFREHCKGLLEFYRKQGVLTPTGDLVAVEELFSGVALARVSYRMLGKDDAIIAQWTHAYVLRRSDTWRLSLSIADDEMAAWSAIGAL